MNALRKDIESAINAHCAENGSNTPDFILAEYLTASLSAFDAAVDARERWYGRTPENYNAPAGLDDTGPQDSPSAT